MLDDEAIAARMAKLVGGGLGTRSRWALETALSAVEAESVGGFLIFEIPSRTKDRVEVHFTAGRCDVVTRWGGS